MRLYIDFLILICWLIVLSNIHPNNNNNAVNESQMIYIFHDYEWNQYIINDSIHGSANSLDYLFDDNVPNSIKAGDNFIDSVSLANWVSEITSWLAIDEGSNPKNNQISFENIISDLWFDNQHSVDDSTWEWEDTLIISLSDNIEKEIGKWMEENSYYTIKEDFWDDETPSLIIEKINESEDELLHAKAFTFTSEWQILPTLLPRDELFLGNSNHKTISYTDSYWSNLTQNNWNNTDPSGISIVEDYASCTTPWWYKIVHWDSVLAYQQKDINSDICNIERRFCWKWKLSGSYTQQGCYTKKTTKNNKERWNDDSSTISESIKTTDTKKNQDWSKTTNKPLWTGSFVFEQPSQASTPEYHISNNIKIEEEVQQTSRPHWDCVAPRWEKVKHGMFVQAFKHSNWFSDAPCQAQLRLCSMWDLIWTYREPSCKTRDTSFIDWINGSISRDTYSREKIEWVKKQIKAEKSNKKDYWKNINSDELDKILNILDK